MITICLDAAFICDKNAHREGLLYKYPVRSLLANMTLWCYGSWNGAMLNVTEHTCGSPDYARFEVQKV